MAKWTTYVICGVVVAIVALTIALVASSLSKLASDEVGIAYDIHQRKLGKTVKKAGLHNDAPGFTFIKFPSVFKSIEFKKITCLNKEGLEIDLRIEFQYRARPQQLRDIIIQFKESETYANMLKLLAKASIYDSCSRFNTSQFQSQRATFQETVLTTMAKRFGAVSADLTDLQVSNIQRPTSYETVVRNKEAAKENIAIALNERPRQLVEAKSKKEDAITNAQILRQTAESKAKIMLSKADAQVKSIMAAYDAEASAFGNLMTRQNLTVEGLLSYLSTRAFADRDTAVSVALDAPAKTKYTYT